MRPTIAATTIALALLAGCGGGDNDTALTPGSSAAPTAEPSASATASATASAPASAPASANPSTKASGKAKPKTTSSSGYDGPSWDTGTATGDNLPFTGPLLPAHEKGAPYPASQLSPEFVGDVIVACEGFEFPVDRLLHPRPASDLSAAVKKGFNGYIDTSSNGIVAIADEHHVIVLEKYPNNPDTFDYAEGFFETSDTGKSRWWVDTDYPPSSCSTRRVLPGLEEVFWNLAVKPKPGDRSIQVSFDGSECNGKSATDRVKVLILGVGPNGIRIALAAEPTKDGDKCAKGKRVLYTVALPEPVGDRPVLNAVPYPEAKPDTDYPTA